MKLTSDHRHALVIPSREPRTDRPDGKQFLIWSCSCGLKRAGNLLPKEEIDEIAKQYKARVSAKAAFSGDASLIDGKGQGGSIL